MKPLWNPKNCKVGQGTPTACDWLQTETETGLDLTGFVYKNNCENWELKAESAEIEDSSKVNKYPKVMSDDKVNQDSWFWLK